MKPASASPRTLRNRLWVVLAACPCCGRSGQVGVGRPLEPGDDTGRVCDAACALCGPHRRETLHAVATADPEEKGAA